MTTINYAIFDMDALKIIQDVFNEDYKKEYYETYDLTNEEIWALIIYYIYLYESVKK